MMKRAVTAVVAGSILLALCGCAGFYAGGDVAPASTHRTLAAVTPAPSPSPPG